MATFLLYWVFLFLHLPHLGMSSLCDVESDGYASCHDVTNEMLLDIEDPTVVKHLSINEDSEVTKVSANTSLTRFTKVETLIMSNLGIEELSPGAFRGLAAVDTLGLDRNRLREVKVGVLADLHSMKNLYLTGNLLERISVGTFDNLKSLESLFLANNSISAIEDHAFKDLVGLKDLSLNENRLTVLQDGVFDEMVKLEIVDLKQNPLKQLGNVGFHQNLRKVILEDCRLKEWNLDLSHLLIKDLALGLNQLEEFDFAKVTTRDPYSYIGLSNNNITILRNFEKSNFSSIYLDNNLLAEVKVIPKNVEYLKLGDNRIKHLAQVTEPEQYQLISLDLSNNEIEHASCLGLSKMTLLKLNHNHITAIREEDFTACKSLENLDLSSNRIEYIAARAFRHLQALYYMDISENKITSLNPDSFEGLKNLNSLLVNENAISSLDVEALVRNLPDLKTFQFTTGEFSCGELKSVLDSLKSHDIWRGFDADSQCKNNN